MASRGAVLGVCAVLIMAIAVVSAEAEAASVVVGLAKCADCTRKNMKAEEAFKGLQVAIKCKNSEGQYESKAVAALEGTGAFSVPLADDLHGADCFAQLHGAANAPCPGQEPSKIVAVSKGTFMAVPGKTHYPSSECASATLCGPTKKHLMDHFHKKPFMDHFHKKPVPSKPQPKPQPHPDYHPVPPTPTHGGSPTPIYHPPAKN